MRRKIYVEKIQQKKFSRKGSAEMIQQKASVELSDEKGR